jgi:hypothetical protein
VKVVFNHRLAPNQSVPVILIVITRRRKLGSFLLFLSSQLPNKILGFGDCNGKEEQNFFELKYTYEDGIGCQTPKKKFQFQFQFLTLNLEEYYSMGRRESLNIRLDRGDQE